MFLVPVIHTASHGMLGGVDYSVAKKQTKSKERDRTPDSKAELSVSEQMGEFSFSSKAGSNLVKQQEVVTEDVCLMPREEVGKLEDHIGKLQNDLDLMRKAAQREIEEVQER